MSQPQHLERKDMEQLQRDTHSRFRQELLKWFSEKAQPRSPEDKPFLASCSSWDGSSKSKPRLFYIASQLEKNLSSLLLRRIIDNYMPDKNFHVPYKGRMKRSWLLEVIHSPDGFAAFGLEPSEVASYLLSSLDANKMKTEHQKENAWSAQHPFVASVPVLGRLFGVDTQVQWGAFDTVNAEEPKNGPSVRLVWDMSKPWESSWIVPVGQSGHCGSRYFANLRRSWRNNESIRVFSEDERNQWF